MKKRAENLKSWALLILVFTLWGYCTVGIIAGLHYNPATTMATSTPIEPLFTRTPDGGYIDQQGNRIGAFEPVGPRRPTGYIWNERIGRTHPDNDDFSSLYPDESWYETDTDESAAFIIYALREA